MSWDRQDISGERSVLKNALSFLKFYNGISDCSDRPDETLCEIDPVMKYPTGDHDML